MKRLLLAFGLVALAWTDAGALSPTCLPTTPAQPDEVIGSMSGSGSYIGTYSILIWREPCQDGSGETAIVFHITSSQPPHPTIPRPPLCSQDQLLEQAGVTIKARLRVNTSAPEFCAPIDSPTTLVIDERPGQPEFDELGAFVISFIFAPPEGPSGFGGAIPPAVSPDPPSPPLSVQVVVTGCTPCKVGDFAKLHLHVVNPGPPRYVEVKAGSHFPDGNVFVFLGRYVEMLIPSGESDIDVPGLVLPAGLPFGTYTIEAALLEPDFGVTLSRHSVTANLNL